MFFFIIFAYPKSSPKMKFLLEQQKKIIVSFSYVKIYDFGKKKNDKTLSQLRAPNSSILFVDCLFCFFVRVKWPASLF